MTTTSRKKVKEHNDKTSPITWKSMLIIPQIISLILFTLVASVLHLKHNNGNIVKVENILLLKEEKPVNTKNGINQECNLFSGKWVYDDVSYPHYKERQCSFMEGDFSCELHGRKNLTFQHWRWQPHNCNLPRFNGGAFLEKIRGKKLIFVGDSLNRNQWKSMLCLIESYLPPSSSKKMKLSGNLWYFQSKEYNATIGFYWAPLLVETNCDDMFQHGGESSQIVRIKSIEKHGRHWTDADILVFDSFAWWLNPNIVAMWGPFGSPDSVQKVVKYSDQMLLYEIGLNTWSEWMEMQINRNKTKVFLMGFSPYSKGYTHWGTSSRCYNTTEPIFDETYWPNAVKRSMMEIAESTIETLKRRAPELYVEYLNITQLSGYREDARPSIYKSFWKSQDKDQFKDHKRFSDCIHWCLPGVPDTWNQFLYAYIMKS